MRPVCNENHCGCSMLFSSMQLWTVNNSNKYCYCYHYYYIHPSPHHSGICAKQRYSSTQF